MKTIELATQSPYTKKNRRGNLDATWYENGVEQRDEIITNKANRDYYYNSIGGSYKTLVANAPAQNRDRLQKMVDAFMSDNFTDDSFFLSVVELVHNTQGLVNSLKKYM